MGRSYFISGHLNISVTKVSNELPKFSLIRVFLNLKIEMYKNTQKFNQISEFFPPIYQPEKISQKWSVAQNEPLNIPFEMRQTSTMSDSYMKRN